MGFHYWFVFLGLQKEKLLSQFALRLIELVQQFGLWQTPKPL